MFNNILYVLYELKRKKEYKNIIKINHPFFILLKSTNHFPMLLLLITMDG